MTEYVAILDDFNESDDEHVPTVRNVRPRANFAMVGDAFSMRFRLSAVNMQWLHTRIGQYLQPAHYERSLMNR